MQPVIDADFDVQVVAGKDLENYIKYYKDITMFSHTSLLYGAYFKDIIDDVRYRTAENEKSLQEVRKYGRDIVPWVLKYIIKQFGGSVALFTSSSTEHLKDNMKYFL